MFSYRHAFHAGNHADVLKHTVVVQLLRYLTQKDKPFWYLDTHAGAGAYALTEGYAAQSREAAGGIAKLWMASDLPPALADYRDAVRTLNPDGALRYYPGSPYLAWQALRESDRLRLFELHSTEIDVLRHNFRDAGRRAMIFAEDGFEGLKRLLPPPPRRALTLFDPSYEDKKDYARTLAALRDALTRFATGVYAIWYPRIQRPDAQRFPGQLKRAAPGSWLHAELTIAAPSAQGPGLLGSGMFVVNPPYTLRAALQEALPYLVRTLGVDRGAGFVLEQS